MIRFVLGFVLGFVVALLSLLSVGHHLRISDGPHEADAIVAPSGDDTGARVRTAVALHRAGYARLIIFSGASESADFADLPAVASAEIMRRQALAAGAPADAILVEPRARTTAENARFVRALMEERGLRSALLVTSPYHQRRAALEFARAFAGSELSFGSVPADDPSWDPTFWWTDPAARNLTLRELAKLSLAVLTR